jgi:hypothetical protein
MKKIPAVYCDIDGVLNKIYKIEGTDYDKFGPPNLNMVHVIKTLAKDFVIVFITGRWAIGAAKVEEHIKNLLPDINCKIFCKPKDYPNITAQFKVDKIKELEAQGFEFYIGFDDHNIVVDLMHKHGLFITQVIHD